MAATARSSTSRNFCQTRPPAGLGVTPDKLDATITRREAVQAAAQQADGEVLIKGRHSQFANESQGERAAASGIGKRTQEKLDRLARQRPDLLEQVRSGDLSVNRAFILAGGDIERWSVPTAPDRLATAIAKRYDTRQLAELVAALLAHLTGPQDSVAGGRTPAVWRRPTPCFAGRRQVRDRLPRQRRADGRG